VTGSVRTETFAVLGMRCEGCEGTVSRAVTALSGVEDACADLVAEEVEVRYDPARVDADAIRAAVREAGFATS
jgi:copper chaperone CopZ